MALHRHFPCMRSLKLWRDKFTALWLDDILQRKPIDESDRDEVIAYLVMLMRSERHGGTIAIRLKIQTKSSHKIHRSELLRLDFVNLNSWIAIDLLTRRRAAKHKPSACACTKQ